LLLPFRGLPPLFSRGRRSRHRHALVAVSKHLPRNPRERPLACIYSYFVASFLAWREERDKANSTSGQLDELKQTFSAREQEWNEAEQDKKRLRDRVAGLSNLWTKGKLVLTNLRDSEVSFDTAKKSADDWMHEVCVWMDANWGNPHDLNLFKRDDEGANQIPDHFPTILRERNMYCRGIEVRLRTLRTIIERESSKLPS
jgi:hypothetical protein